MKFLKNKLIVFFSLVFFIFVCSIGIFISNVKKGTHFSSETTKTQQQLQEEQNQQTMMALIIIAS